MNTILAWLAANWKVSVAALALAGTSLAAVIERAEAQHYSKLYQAEVSARAADQASVRQATATAQAADAANVARVQTAQATITKQVSDDYDKQIADARARAADLADQLASVQQHAKTADGGGSVKAVPAVSAATGSADGASGDQGLSGSSGDAASRAMTVQERLAATETAIRLMALQDWVRGQAGVDVTGNQQ
jgi:hypothetical protein